MMIQIDDDTWLAWSQTTTKIQPNHNPNPIPIPSLYFEDVCVSNTTHNTLYVEQMTMIWYGEWRC